MMKVLFLASEADGPMRVDLPRGATTLTQELKTGKMSTVSQINFTEFWSVFISIFYIFAIIANGCIL